MNVLKYLKYLIIIASLIYIVKMAVEGIARVLKQEIGLSITTLPHERVNFHPLYTFCPEWIDIELESNRVPEDFIKSYNLKGGVDHKDGFWSTKFKLIDEGRFIPCYTFEKTKPVVLGTYEAVIKFVVQMDLMRDLSLTLHDSHGYIDTHYSTKGNGKLVFPDQNLGGKVSREMRYEISSIFVSKLPTANCKDSKFSIDEYCLERRVLNTLRCQIPGSSLNTVELGYQNCTAKKPGLPPMVPDPDAISRIKLFQHLGNLDCLESCDVDEYYPELNYDKLTENGVGENAQLTLYFELKNQNRESHEEYYVYDLVTFLATFGGNVGLLLGFSLLGFYDQVKSVIC